MSALVEVEMCLTCVEDPEAHAMYSQGPKRESATGVLRSKSDLHLLAPYSLVEIHPAMNSAYVQGEKEIWRIRSDDKKNIDDTSISS